MKKIFLFLFIFLVGFIFTKEVSAQTAPSLSVVLGTGFVTTPTPGSSIELSKFIFIADGTDDIKINSLTITRSGASNDHDIINLKLIDSSSGTQFGATSGFAFGKATFANVNYIIPKGSSRTLAVRADVDYTFTSTSSVYIGINSASDISAVGTASALVSSIPGTFPLNVYSSTVTTSSIEVLSPNGGELLEVGKPYNIKWSSSNINSIIFSIANEQGSVLGTNLTNTINYDTKEAVWIPNDTVIKAFPDIKSYKISAKGCQYANMNDCGDSQLVFDLSDAPFSIMAAGTATSSIKVTSPNGGESLEIGKTYDIAWTSNGTEKVHIDITSPGGAYTLTSGILASSGKYSWTVNKSWPYLSAGTQYKIRVFTYPLPASGAWQEGVNYDQSDNYFSVVGSTALSSIKVTSPNGGEIWQIGQTYPIKWTTAGYSADALIQISLWDTRYNYDTVITKTANSGSYNFTVPSSLGSTSGGSLGGSNIYKIRAQVYSTSFREGVTTDASDASFSITEIKYPIDDIAKSIKVTSPNGGEKWERGKVYDIIWESSGIDPVNVTVQCEKYSYGAYTVKMFGVKGSYPFNTSSRDEDQNDCKVMVYDASLASNPSQLVQNSTVDYSDTSFSIITATSTAGVLKADLKVNDSDHPVVPINYGSKFTASWISSGASYCAGYGNDIIVTDGSIWGDRTRYPASGSKTLYAKSASGSVPFSIFHLGLQCWDDFGNSTTDLIGNIPVAIQTTGVVPMAVPIKDGSVVKIQGAPDVYFIKDGQKIKINSPKEFEEKGYKWDQIQTVQSDLLAQIAELKAQVKQLKEDIAKAGALLKSMTGNDVYIIKDGKKEKISDPETFNKRGYKWDQIKSVSQEDLESIPEYTSSAQQTTTASALPQGIIPGSLVKSPNSPTVYYITPTGAKKPILNIKVFNSYNNKWDNVKTVSQDEINLSPTVNAIRIGNDPKVYFISNGQKQWVKTPEAFAKQGLKWDQIVSVNKTEFDEYKEGEEIK